MAQLVQSAVDKVFKTDTEGPTAVGTEPEPWPSEEDSARLAVYERNRLLYEGKHEEVFVDSGDYNFETPEGMDYLTINLIGARTDVIVGRMFGEPAVITFPPEFQPTSDYIQHVIKTNGLHAQHSEAATGCSIRGDAVFKVAYDPDRWLVRVYALDPTMYFPEYSDIDPTHRIAVNLDRVLYDTDEEETAYVYRERYEMRLTDATVDAMESTVGLQQPIEEECWVTNQLFLLEEDTGNPGTGKVNFNEPLSVSHLEATAQLDAEFNTQLSRIPIVHIKNRVIDREDNWGLNDVDELISINGQINWRHLQRAKVLDEFVEPFVFGPPMSEESEDGTDEGQTVKLGNHRYIEVETPHGAPAAAPIGTIEWDANLTSVVEAIRELTEKFAIVGRIDMEVLLQSGVTGAMSGFALRLRQLKTQITVLQRTTVWSAGLSELYSVITEVAAVDGRQLIWTRDNLNAITHVSSEDITVRFGDGLPRNILEELQEETIKLQHGLQTRLKAVMRLEEIDEESAQQLVDAATLETQLAHPSDLGPFNFGDEEDEAIGTTLGQTPAAFQESQSGP